MKTAKPIRYALIISCLNLVYAIIIAIVVGVSRIYNWQWSNWEWYDYWILGSVLAPIAIFVGYLSPVIEQILFNKLQEKLISITENQIAEYEKQIIELKSALTEIKELE